MSVKSVFDYISQLKDIYKDPHHEYYYRGHAKISFEKRPAVYRNNFVEHEDKLFKEIILRTPNDFINEKTALEKLVKMQHYGIPTRLLDITTNPLIALYFACDKFHDASDKEDGEVLVFKIPKKDIKFYDSDTVSVLANLAKRPADFSIKDLDKSTREAFNNEAPIQYLLHEIKDEKPQFAPYIIHEDFSRVVAVKVKYSNNRILKQSGAFLIFGMNGSKNIPAEIPNEWILNLDDKGVDLRTDKDYKKIILEELDTLGINESTLFPELEKQAEYLKKHYMG